MKMKHLWSVILAVGAAVFLGASSARAQEAYFAVTTYADGVDAKPGDGICATAAGECTLRAAIQEANLGQPGWMQRVVLQPGEYLLSIAGTGEESGATGDLDVTGLVRIEGPLAEPTAGPFAFVDGGGLDRVLHVHFGATVYISGVVVRNGHVLDSDGGGVLNEGELHMEASQVVGNTTGSFGNGGGITNRRWLTLSGVTVSGNSSTLGGGIFNAGEIDLAETTVSQNKVDGEGAGIFNYKHGTIQGVQVTINENQAVGSYGGGGIYNQGKFDVSDSTITGNSAGWSGGGVANIGTMTLTKTNVTTNTSQGPGGGIYSGGTMTVTGGSVTNNTSASGGGIANYDFGDMNVDGVQIANNTTTGFGGGVENANAMSLMNVTVEGNNAVYGGGIANTGVGYDATSFLKISGSTVQSNVASGYGGGLINVYGIAEVRQSLVAQNVALLGAGFTSYFGSSTLYETTIRLNHTLETADMNAGGGVYAVGDGKVSLERCTIAENTAEYGAGVFTDTGNVVLTQSTVYNNVASVSGGGLFNFLAGTAAEGSSGPSSSPIVKINPSLNAQVEGPRALDMSLTMLNTSTVSGNEAGTSGGGIYNTSLTEITNSTIAYNKSTDSDAIYNVASARIIIGNSILRSATGTVPTCAGGGLVQSRGFNLEDRRTCSLSGKDDIVDTDPLLGPLADNGGPTLTHALLPGSQAIDAGSNILCGAIDGGEPTDQRGQARPMDGNDDGGAVCDIGAFEVQGATRSFGDVSEGHWAYGYIEWLYDDNYIAGCSANPRLYCPDVGMNRAEASVFVERGVHGAGYEPAEPSSSFFTDVPLGLWFTKWVQQLWVDGFTAGCSVDPSGNRQFCPFWPHTRAEATVFFTRMMMGPTYQPPTPTRQIFADVPIGTGAPWYSAWVNAAYEAGIIGTCEDLQLREAGMFHPNANLRRSEGACMMINALGRGAAFPTPTVVAAPTTVRTTTPTRTATGTAEPTPTATRTPSPTGTATRTTVATPTATRTATPTRTATRTVVATPTATRTSTRTSTPTPMPTTVAGIWRPAASVPIHWQWQIGTPLNTSRDLMPYVTVYDIDAFANDADTVSYLHSQGFKVIAYVSFGSWEDWRPDASSFPSSVLGRSNGWPGERWLDIRSDTVKTIMAARLDMIKQKGFDGVEPDNIDGYSNNTGFPLSAQDQIDYNRWIAEQGHARGLSVGLKNDVEQAAALQPYFEWTLNEECYQYSECDGLQVFTNANKAVFQVEYSGTGQCSTMRSMHFNSMTRDLDLVGPNDSGYTRTPCVPDTQNTW